VTVLDTDVLHASVERDGYCVVRGVLSPAECDAVRAALDRCAEEDAARGRVWSYDGGANQRHFTLLNRGDEFVSLATNPIVLDGPAMELKPDTERTGHTKGTPYRPTEPAVDSGSM
jgi:Phytanoyl-CoA dioxygenase (PhyH)